MLHPAEFWREVGKINGLQHFVIVTAFHTLTSCSLLNVAILDEGKGSWWHASLIPYAGTWDWCRDTRGLQNRLTKCPLTTFLNMSLLLGPGYAKAVGLRLSGAFCALSYTLRLRFGAAGCSAR